MSANAFNLDQSKILLFGKEFMENFNLRLRVTFHLVCENTVSQDLWLRVNSVPNYKIVALTKLKAFADDKINVAQTMISVFDR